MGKVYRARDPRLHRDVAIKVLPSGLTDDPDRRSRLEREARVLASFNHPHIAQVYGLEDAGGSIAIVMELVNGPTLASLIGGYESAPLALSRVLAIARQIADGLDAAHEKGIIHRDLKPANVAVTEDGDVKILDFGVAKSLDGRMSTTAGAPLATDAGVVLGTPAYMSPEQARGLPVDRRTDVWAFGCLLYELLTGRQPFAGETPTDSLAAVLGREPDMTILPAATPAGVRTLLRHCLEKEAKKRLRDIADARLALDDVLNQGNGLAAPAADLASVRASGRWRWLVATGLGTLAVVALAFTWWSPGAARSRTPARVVASLVLPEGMTLAGTDPWAGGRGAIRRVAGWAQAGDCRVPSVRPAADLDPRIVVRSAPAHPGDRRRVVSVLVSRFRVDRVRRAGQAQDSQAVGLNGRDGQRRRVPRWHLEPRRRDPVHAEERLAHSRDIGRRWRVEGGDEARPGLR